MNGKKWYLLGYGVLALISLAVISLLVWRAYTFDQSVKDVPQEITVAFKINYGQGKVTDLGRQTVRPPFTVKSLYDGVSVVGTVKVVLEQKPLGSLVKSVGGVEASGGNFWLTYLNGELVPGDLNTAQIKAGDSVELKYNKL